MGGYVFADGAGNLYLQRCPDCDSENWEPAVAEGTCAWCGYEASAHDLNEGETSHGPESDEFEG